VSVRTSPDGGVQLRRLYDVALASDFPFAIPLPGINGTPDLTFAAVSSPPPSGGRHGRSPVYTSPRRRPDGTSGCRLYHLPECEMLSFPGADFCLWPDRIVCHLPDAARHHLVETYLLGPVLCYWLERQNIPVLHASAVTVDGSAAAAFLASGGTGKSGMAAALLQHGAALLADDLVPVEARGATFLARPGFPQLRMWPDEAACFAGLWEHLPRVSPETDKRWVPAGAFHDAPLPLSCLYLLDRRPASDAPIEIRDLSPRDALIELLRHSFTPLLVEAAGLQPARFDLLSRLVLQVPVRRLRYPSGFDRLPGVAEAVRLDLERAR
jgi:hypothetical protein